MHPFKPGDDASVIGTNGKEVEVKIESEPINGFYHVRVYDEDGILSGGAQNVNATRLRVLKGPFFDVRGQVLTTSSIHPSEVGEIIGTGTSRTGKVFCKVQFSDGSNEWFSEDQVFIDDEVKRAHDEAANDKEFFK